MTGEITTCSLFWLRRFSFGTLLILCQKISENFNENITLHSTAAQQSPLQKMPPFSSLKLHLLQLVFVSLAGPTNVSPNPSCTYQHSEISPPAFCLGADNRGDMGHYSWGTKCITWESSHLLTLLSIRIDDKIQNWKGTEEKPSGKPEVKKKSEEARKRDRVFSCQDSGRIAKFCSWKMNETLELKTKMVMLKKELRTLLKFRIFRFWRVQSWVELQSRRDSQNQYALLSSK